MTRKAPWSEMVQNLLRLDRAIKLVWQSAPGWTVVNAALVVMQGLLPLAALYLMKLIIDTVAAAVTHPGDNSVFGQILPLIVLAAAVALLSAVCRSLAELTSEAQSMVVTDNVADVIHAKSIAVDLEYYENPIYYD
ncbi:MAG: hypothetical protein PHY31_09225, partial [Smithellaceae bacterium]|nr:hypothetical protein [Smithellaceae bacterium]